MQVAARANRIAHTHRGAGEFHVHGQRRVVAELVVLDGVFEQRLQGQRRDQPAFAGTRVGEHMAQIEPDRGAETQVEKAVVVAHEGEFVAEPHEVAVAARQHVAIDLGERVAELAPAPRVVRDQVAERIQAVEEEVWIDLRLQRAEFGFCPHAL